MLVTAVAVALAGAALARRVPWVRRRLPPPASTTTMAVAAAAALLVESAGAGRPVVVGIATAVIGALGTLLLGVVSEHVARPLHRYWLAHREPTIPDRLVARADAVTWRVGRWNLVTVTVRSVVRAGEVRLTGLAAEMSYYALVSLVPITTALGSSLGYLRPLLGDERIETIRSAIVEALTTIFAQQLTGDTLAPLVDGLLDEGRAGVAIGAALVTLYLASRVFRAAVRALDDAYRVQARRSVVAQYLLGTVFTIGALVALVGVAVLVVIGPLLGDGEALATRLGLSEVFRVSWDVLRWPVACGLGLAFLTLLYRYAPNVDTDWRQCLPGAIVGLLGLLLVSAGFAFYVRAFAPTLETADAADTVVQAAAQMLSLVLAGVLWLWLASIVVLLGGILNAELDAEWQPPADALPVEHPEAGRGRPETAAG